MRNFNFHFANVIMGANVLDTTNAKYAPIALLQSRNRLIGLHRPKACKHVFHAIISKAMQSVIDVVMNKINEMVQACVFRSKNLHAT